MNNLPIEHLSYSALSCFLSNPALFKKHYILNIWDNKTTPSALVGKAFHIYPEMLFAGANKQEAERKAYEYIENIKDSDVDWGKTGSREKCVKELARVISFFDAEKPFPGEVKATEFKKTVTPSIDGKSFPVPIKAISDMVSVLNDEVIIWDWKVVTSFTEDEEEIPPYILQSVFNYFTVASEYGDPKRMFFFEIKKSQNKDGTPQTHVYEIDFSKHTGYFNYFGRLYGGILKNLSDSEFLFLPNLNDGYGGKEVWKDFTAETLDFSMPTQVSHKSVTMHNVEKSYVESLIDKEEAKTLMEDQKIIAKLQEFGVVLSYQEKYSGPNVIMYCFKPSRAVKMSTITKYEDDLKLALKVKSLRILAPIPGTGLVGVEVPNQQREILKWDESMLKNKSLEIPIGVDVYNKPHTLDLTKAPHLLVAGATGSGKSVALNVFIHSLSSQNSINELGLILIDPKRSEFFGFENDPHLLNEVITEPEDAYAALSWAIVEMERRYILLKENRCRNIQTYNQHGGMMQYVVIVIDELADLLLRGDISKEIEKSIVRLAQKARAVGIHLIAATQRPSVDVVTGLLKANFPTRIAFSVATSVDSKVILDQPGAEQLIGAGDCLFMSPSEKGLLRLQAYYKA